MQAETSKTKMQAPSAPVRMRAIRDCAVGSEIYKPGMEFEAPPELAADLIKPITSTYAFDGMRSDRTADRDVIVRAERI